MELTSRKQSSVVVVEVQGRVDAATAPDFEKHLLNLIAQGENKFVLNCSALDYISSAGLRSILVVSKKLKESGGSVVLAGLKGAVEEVFTISGFHTILRIFDSEESAVSQI